MYVYGCTCMDVHGWYGRKGWTSWEHIKWQTLNEYLKIFKNNEKQNNEKGLMEGVLKCGINDWEWGAGS